MTNKKILSITAGHINKEALYVDFGTDAGYDDPTEVGIQMSNHNGNNLPYGTFKLAELAEALNAIPGFTASFESPITFPTKPGTMLVTYKDVDGEPTDTIRFFRTMNGWVSDMKFDIDTPRTDAEVVEWLNKKTERHFNVVPPQD